MSYNKRNKCLISEQKLSNRWNYRTPFCQNRISSFKYKYLCGSSKKDKWAKWLVFKDCKKIKVINRWHHITNKKVHCMDLTQLFQVILIGLTLSSIHLQLYCGVISTLNYNNWTNQDRPSKENTVHWIKMDMETKTEPVIVVNPEQVQSQFPPQQDIFGIF